MLGSVPVGGQLLPFETTHAHNYFIHNWVELGVLGLLGVVGLFLAPVLVGGWRLFQNMRQDLNLQKVLLIVVDYLQFQMIQFMQNMKTVLFQHHIAFKMIWISK